MAEKLSLRDKYIKLMIKLKDKYEIINGYGKGGFWMRGLDGSKLDFTNEDNFIPYTKAKRLARTVQSVR